MEKVVLCVDDDEDSVYLLKRAMDEAGPAYSMQVASDGEMAIDYFKGSGNFQDREAHPLPCLVLLDLKLPRTPGLGVLKWIRKEAGLSVPVIILSSSQNEVDISAAYQLGANAYLVKPSDYERLLEMAKMIAGFWLMQNVTPAAK
jgi:DNA-binding response OmpR family regulator